MKKISFDFDDTLEHIHIQEYAKKLIKREYEIHIVTTRYKNTDDYEWRIPNKSYQHKDIYLVANKLGILHFNIHFTNMSWKWNYFKKNKFLLHFDDNNEEVANINSLTNTKAIDIFQHDWKLQSEKILKDN